MNKANGAVADDAAEQSSDGGAARFDVIVAGGGMTGGLLAAALGVDSSLEICVLESREPAPFEPGSTPEYAIRVSALSIATERMFRRVGAWQGVLERRACPYRSMRVWSDDDTRRRAGKGRGKGSGEDSGEDSGRSRRKDSGTDSGKGSGTVFDAADIDAEALGHIVENRVVQLALLERLAELPNVTVKCPARLESCQVRQGATRVTLDDGEVLHTRLLVGADGASSAVRELAGFTHVKEPYEQHALVATVATRLPQQSITWQHFVPSGPQAFLPLCGAHASMVWYHEPDEIARLKALDDDAFAREMEATFPTELGGIERVIERASFPIARAHADQYVAEGIALIGDAAHTVHPLAGQGVNLGMLDAACLAEVIVAAERAGRDIGTLRTLRKYERWRRGENALMIAILDGFHRAFGPQPAPLRRLRSLVLDAADKGGPIKMLVMKRAMGLVGDLPMLARYGD